MIQFNTGVMIGKPVAGNESPNPTPLALGILQEGAFDVSWEVKELYGQSQFPVDVAKGKGKVSGTAKFASVTGKTVNDLFFGQSLVTQANVPVYLEAHAASATVTIAPPGSGTFLADLGVLYGASGIALTKVTSAPAAGLYEVNEATGVYTFTGADTSVAGGFLISYLYTAGSGVGFKAVIANQLMGFGPVFELDFFVQYAGSNPGGQQTMLMRAYNSIMTKWGVPTKQGDYLIQDVAFSCFANAAGNIFELDYTS